MAKGHFVLSLLFTSKRHTISDRGKLSKWLTLTSNDSYVMSSRLLLGKSKNSANRNELSEPLRDNFIDTSTRASDSKYSEADDTISLSEIYSQRSSPLGTSDNSFIVDYNVSGNIFKKGESLLRTNDDSEATLDYDSPLNFYSFKDKLLGTLISNTNRNRKPCNLQKKDLANETDSEEAENIDNTYNTLGLNNYYNKVKGDSLECPSALQRALEKLSYVKTSAEERLSETFFNVRKPQGFHVTLSNEDAFCECNEYLSDEEQENLTLSSLKGFFFKDEDFIKDRSDFSNRNSHAKVTKDKTQPSNLYGAFRENQTQNEQQSFLENDLEVYKDYILLLNPKQGQCKAFNYV